MDKVLAAEIEALQQELAKASTLDNDERDILSRVVSDVTTLTAEKTGGGQGDSDEHHAVRERLREMVARFEVKHPQIAASVERLINALSSIGV